MPEEKNKKVENCRGSFTRGTACAICPRCKKRGYGPQEKKAAILAEAERTKDLPKDRVKKTQQIKVVNN